MKHASNLEAERPNLKAVMSIPLCSFPAWECNKLLGAEASSFPFPAYCPSCDRPLWIFPPQEASYSGGTERYLRTQLFPHRSHLLGGWSNATFTTLWRSFMAQFQIAHSDKLGESILIQSRVTSLCCNAHGASF